MAAWFAIVILTAQADNLASGLTEELQSVTWLAKAAATISTSIVPATVTIINAVMPIIIKARVFDFVSIHRMSFIDGAQNAGCTAVPKQAVR